MILVDTSVWVDHLRFGNRTLVSLLEGEQVLIHPFVVGELACGQLRNRSEILRLLARLPGVVLAGHEEVLTLVESRHLFGRGLGWIDAHLLSSAVLARAGLLTLDKRLGRLSRMLGVAA